ncbi:unnamed protein product [Adineta steineri]|uniref:Uncharacterized protein n=1 Tax=Adineta steineri TaxID=433720 RepID=A0A813XJ39_9BILA|nr:unnamed protein product [Adineta steineri]CAF3977292.1 unnamed protein product [Adineta steineri]
MMNQRHIQCEPDLQNFTDFEHNQLQNIFVRVSNTLNKSRNIPSLMLTAYYDSVNTYHGLVLSPILDQFSIKSGHKLNNKTCRSSTNCTFDDRFNRSLVIEHIQIELIEKNYSNYRIRIQHALSYNIQILSLWNIGLTVQKQFDIPRKETIVGINVYSTISIFEINIKIQ